MRVNALSSILYAVILLTSFFDVVTAYHGRRALSRRDWPFGSGGFFDHMFPHPSRPPKKGSPPTSTPTTKTASTTASTPASTPTSAPSQAPNPFNMTNIQADAVFPMNTVAKSFSFFNISNVQTFKQALGTTIHARITTAAQSLPGTTLPSTVVNIGFTIDGLNALGITDNLGDSSFSGRQINDIDAIGDPGTTNWVEAFTGQDIQGIFIVGAGSKNDVDTAISELVSTSNGISEVYRLEGLQRPNDQAGHEYFGFKDGLGQPCLDGMMDCSQPGVSVVPQGVIIVGAQGDSTPRPGWAAGGSMMAFRQLQELAPEFDKFAQDNAIQLPGFTQDQGAALLKARMFGRWQDGTPLELSPLKPDPTLAADRLRNNDFTYSQPLASNQSNCPFSAHIRKTNPRNDLPGNLNHIMRSSIVYGGEVTPEEEQAQTTQQDRGLAFLAYQSSIPNGFLFQQQTWANTANFPPNKDQTIGFDPVIGANHGQARNTSGLDPTNVSKSMSLPEFVRSRGGAYFFSPPLSACAVGGKLTQ